MCQAQPSHFPPLSVGGWGSLRQHLTPPHSQASQYSRDGDFTNIQTDRDRDRDRDRDLFGLGGSKLHFKAGEDKEN